MRSCSGDVRHGSRWMTMPLDGTQPSPRSYGCRRRHDGIVNLLRGSALLPRDIDAPDRFQQAHVTASHSTNARVRSRRW